MTVATPAKQQPLSLDELHKLHAYLSPLLPRRYLHVLNHLSIFIRIPIHLFDRVTIAQKVKRERLVS